MSDIDFSKQYNREDWVGFLESHFLPEDFKAEERKVPYTGAYTQEVTKLGECPESLGLTVFEIQHKSKNDARVGLSKEAFRLVCNHTLHSRALILFVPKNDGDIYRFSFVEFTPIVTEAGKTERNYSNPRRYSFLLGKNAKIKTPQRYLIQNGKKVTDYNDLKSRFSIEVLNKEFFERLAGKYDKNGKLVKEGWYQKCFNDIKIDLSKASQILSKKIDDELKPQAVIRVIIRLMFIWFMKEKGIITNYFFTRDFSKQYLKTENTYYNAILQNLFFAVLNKEKDDRRFHRQNESHYYDPERNDYGIFDVFRYKNLFKYGKAEEFLKLTQTIPFVNGGLFTCHDYKFSGKDLSKNKNNTDGNYIIDGFSDNQKDCAKISDEIIFQLIDLFNDYAFTVEENMPNDVVVALDPELLGTVLENLIGSYNPETKETARKTTGSFYTPREIVDYMCRESLKETLKAKFPDLQEQIDDLIDSSEDKLNFRKRVILLQQLPI
jgi:hypothetical protein